MGRKGQKRREKNYRAAHAGSSMLPPPPDPSSLEALPSKLRKILSFSGAARKPSNGAKRNMGSKDGMEILPGKEHSSTTKGGSYNKQSMTQHMVHDDQVVQQGSHEKKKKKKRKRNVVNDLRFDDVDASGVSGSKRKERRKMRLEARKKKHKRAKIEESVDFRGREEIKFGEVVEAPPKLMAIPKVLKTTQDASQERLRLQAVDAYRKRKGWASRLGAQLPSPVTTSSL